MKKTLFLLILIGLFFGNFALASPKVEVKFFYSKTCPHCAEERAFLEGEIAQEYPEVEISKFPVSENIELLKKFYQEYQVPKEKHGWVPVTFIEGDYFLGFSEDIGEDIKDCIDNKIKGIEQPCSSEKEEVALPIIGEIDASKYSLPALSAILGFFDGFNVCSLGALVLILGLVLAFKQRKKIFVYGAVFIATTALIYGLLIIVWHQIFSALASY